MKQTIKNTFSVLGLIMPFLVGVYLPLNLYAVHTFYPSNDLAFFFAALYSIMVCLIMFMHSVHRTVINKYQAVIEQQNREADFNLADAIEYQKQTEKSVEMWKSESDRYQSMYMDLSEKVAKPEMEARKKRSLKTNK